MGQVSECRLTPFKDEDVVVVQMLTERTDSITFSVIAKVRACRLTQFEEGVQDVVVQIDDRADGFHHVSQWVG